MGRPHLRDALASLCQQDYATLEVVVVDATGGRHPPLPDLPWKAGHEVRMVSEGRQLPRPQAANAGLLAARGEWLSFLDDDDQYDPDFVSLMVAQTALHPDCLLIYGSAKIIDEHDQVQSVFGSPFNRALMYCGPLFYWQTALINRRVIDLDCRFDETLPVCEDRDFLAQIAEHSEFAFVPVTATRYGLTTGTSGTTVGDNRHPERHIPFESRLRAKWAGSGLYHMRRAAQGCRSAVLSYFGGNVDAALDRFRAVLTEYPDDPNALHGVGRISLERGDASAAADAVRRAVEIAPAVAEYRWTLANILHVLGEDEAAREQALIVAADAQFRDAARALLRELPAPAPAPSPSPAATQAPAPASIRMSAPVDTTSNGQISRLAMCPCGSGQRYKNCHGRAGSAAIVASTTANPTEQAASRAVNDAKRLFDAGEATRALELLANASPAAVSDASTNTQAGSILLECGELTAAQSWFTRALEIDPDCSAGALLNQCTEMLNASTFAASAYRQVAAVCERLARVDAPPASDDPTVHIIATLGSVGGSERHALNLFRVLSQHIRAELWSTDTPHPSIPAALGVKTITPASNSFPRTGTLVLIGQYFELGEWIAHTDFRRIVIRNNLDQPQAILERATDLELLHKRLILDFNYPSEHYRRRVGLPGGAEYSLTDLELFSPRDVASASPAESGLVIGRHSRDDRLKHHPNDASFFRHIVAQGHRVRLMGATPIAAALARGAPEPRIEIVPFASEPAPRFLASLDCFLYRAHPHWYETGGNVVAEAMATQLPVIVFGDQIGFADVIKHGSNGFRVSTEAEAMTIIAQLAASVDLRNCVGQRARETMVQLAADQTQRTLRFYRDHA